MVEREELKAASDILKEHVHPDSHVLVIGPNFSPMLDPSSFYLSAHLSHRKGRLTLLDNKSTDLLYLTRAKLARLRKGGKLPSRKIAELHRKLILGDQDRDDNPAGVGDPHTYGNCIRAWKRIGFPMKSPRILISDARKIELPSNSVDVVFEHGTLPWLRNTPRALAEYLRVVRPGGKVIIFTNDRATDIHDELKALLSEVAGEKQAKLREDDFRRSIARVSEHEFVPAYSILELIRSVDPQKVKLDRLRKESPHDREAALILESAGKRHFWMTSLHNAFPCSKGFVIEKAS